MKALVYHGNRDLRLEAIPDPEPGPGEVRLRIDYCGICATDVEEYVYGPNHIYHDKPNPLTGKQAPLVVGHETSGTVEKLGAGVSGTRLTTVAIPLVWGSPSVSVSTGVMVQLSWSPGASPWSPGTRVASAASCTAVSAPSSAWRVHW